MKAEEFVNELGQKLKLGELSLGVMGACNLVFDSIHPVEILYVKDKEMLRISSPVGMLPEGNKVEFMAQLMEGNLFGQGTGGAVLTVEKNLGLIMMYQQFVLDHCNYDAFESGLESFLNYLESWKKKLEEAAPSSGGMIAPPGAGPEHFRV